METLKLVLQPVRTLVMRGKRHQVNFDYQYVQGYLNSKGCYRHKLVGTTLYAVKCTFKRQDDPQKPFFGRMVIDHETSEEKLKGLLQRFPP